MPFLSFTLTALRMAIATPVVSDTRERDMLIRNKGELLFNRRIDEKKQKREREREHNNALL